MADLYLFDGFNLLHAGPYTDVRELVDALASQRAAARAAKDFAESDRLRDELAAAGWEMRDEPGGGHTLVRR